MSCFLCEDSISREIRENRGIRTFKGTHQCLYFSCHHALSFAASFTTTRCLSFVTQGAHASLQNYGATFIKNSNQTGQKSILQNELNPKRRDIIQMLNIPSL